MTEQKGKTQAPTSTWRFWRHLKPANHQVIQKAIANKNTWSKGALTSHETIYGYKYSPIWTEIQSIVRLPTFESIVRLSTFESIVGLLTFESIARLCPLKLQKVACPNEVLSDYFTKFKLCEWSFFRLFYENQNVRMKFCQFKSWMLYCTNSPFYAAVDVPRLGASHWKLLNTRVHLGAYPFLLSMSVTSLCSPLGSNPAWQWSLKTSLILFPISPFDWTYFWLKTATFE